MCCKKKTEETGFKFIHTSSNGTTVEFTVPDEVTWNELGEQFRCFVSACGFIIKRDDCLCGADSDGTLIDDIHCMGCTCSDEDDNSYDGAPT